MDYGFKMIFANDSMLEIKLQFLFSKTVNLRVENSSQTTIGFPDFVHVSIFDLKAIFMDLKLIFCKWVYARN